MKAGLLEAKAIRDSYFDAIEHYGEPEWDLIEEAEGDGPMNVLQMSLDFISMEPYAYMNL